MLQACLADPEVTELRALVRRPTGVTHPKLREVVHTDDLDYGVVSNAFSGVDTCLFCLGISVRQVPDEAGYRRIHRDFPMVAAQILREQSPGAIFHYLSGSGAGLHSRWMWARVKAESERDLMAEYGATCWRPAMIGGRPTAPPPLILAMLRPVLKLLFRPIKTAYVENEAIGRGMLRATVLGIRNRIIENAAIRDLAAGRSID